LQFPGAANFPTHAQLTVRDAPCGALAAVALSCLVRCSAGVPWVMQKTVEGLMADQAKQSLAGFLDFCEVRGAGSARLLGTPRGVRASTARQELQPPQFDAEDGGAKIVQRGCAREARQAGGWLQRTCARQGPADCSGVGAGS
jgi:hypothetical protein